MHSNQLFFNFVGFAIQFVCSLLLLADAAAPNCPDVCQAVYKPVCGRNANGYREFSNSCVLGVHNCQNPSNRYETVDAAYCQNDCDKRICSYLYGNFCITDGFESIHVNSLCDIERLKCRTGRNFQMAPASHCECPPIPCTREYSPVCATCGASTKTFSNLCELKASTCNYTKNHVPIDESFCTNPTVYPSERKCWHQYYPVCTETNENNFELVASPCRLHRRNYNNNREVFKVVNINMCRTTVSPKCRNQMCTSYEFAPVCASNSPGAFKWFGNQCSLRLYNCIEGDEYLRAPLRYCNGIIDVNIP